MYTGLEKEIRKKLRSFNKKKPLPGIKSPIARECFIKYIVESVQRVEQVTVIGNSIQHVSCTDVKRKDFHPLKAAKYYKQEGNIDEAFWLVFLATHFGEDTDNPKKKTGWQWVSDVYGALGNTPYWTWKRTSGDPDAFRKWLSANKSFLKGRGRFSNHRKYMSLKDSHTGMAVATYVDWIGRNHQDMITAVKKRAGTNPNDLFDALYKKMEPVMHFGRTGRFDYLSYLSKLGLLNIEPGHPYLIGATGPLEGARLLLGENKMPAKVLNIKLQELGEHLNLGAVNFQCWEDAVCNFGKSPSLFLPTLVSD